MFNYVALHAAIKAKIAAHDGSFFYVVPQNWGDFSQGEFPETLDDRGYAIQLNNQSLTLWEEANRNIMNITIEFALESSNDIYLAQLANAVDAIGELTDITATGLCAIYDDGDLQNFQALYLPKDMGNGKVIVQFSNIRAELQE